MYGDSVRKDIPIILIINRLVDKFETTSFYPLFYPLRILLPLACGKPKIAQLQADSYDLRFSTPALKKTIPLPRRCIVVNNTIIQRKNIRNVDLSNLNKFILNIKKNATDFDSDKIIKVFLDSNKAKLTQNDFNLIMETLLTLKNGGGLISTFCSTFLYNEESLEENYLLERYEKFLVEFFMKKENSLAKTIYHQRGSVYFCKIYCPNRITPIELFLDALKKRKNLGHEMKLMFESKICNNSKGDYGKKGVLYYLKHIDPEVYDDIWSTISKSSKTPH